MVYPKHGVGKITSIEKAKIGDIDIQFYKILVEKEKLTLTVPINQQSKLRPISSINQINKCVSILKTKPKKELKELCGVEELKNTIKKLIQVKFMNWQK